MNTDVSWLLVTRHRANLTRRRELHVARLDFSSVAHITQCRPPLPPRTARRFTRQAFPAPSACRVCPLAVHSAILYLLRRWLASSAGIRGEPAPPTSLPRGLRGRRVAASVVSRRGCCYSPKPSTRQRLYTRPAWDETRHWVSMSAGISSSVRPCRRAASTYSMIPAIATPCLSQSAGSLLTKLCRKTLLTK